MTHLKSPTAGGTVSGVELQVDDLTREQKRILSRIVHRFRESAVGQTLIGAPETGKSSLADLVGKCLEEQVEPVLISKSQEGGGGNRRLIFEAYSSYTQFLSAVLKQLGFFARGEEPDLVEQLVEQLRRLRSEDKRLLLIVDDAQEMDPAVWKRLQPWLDFQDRGVRMIQVLLVGSPELKKKLSEPSMRGWRRWIHGTYELQLVKKWGTACDEARRILKRACQVINEKTQPTEPIRPPQISWFAVRKIVKESGGRPGRMTELLKRALSASIREGGCRITYRFLSRADALRSPAMQWYKLRQNKKNPVASRTSGIRQKLPLNLRGSAMKERTRNPRIPEHPMGWMRYALGTLLIVFILGAGWGITAWLSVDNPSADVLLVADETSPVELDLSETDPEDSVRSEEDDLSETLSVATTEPVEEYPLDVFDESWKTIDPVEASRAISASLEQEFMNLEVSGSQVAENFPSVPEEDSVLPAATLETEPSPETVVAASEVPSTPRETTVADAASSFEALEDFSLPEFESTLENPVKVEAEPLDAKALDVPEELLHQTVSTGVVSIPAPPALDTGSADRPAVASSRRGPESSPSHPVTPRKKKRSASRERLLKAMSRLEKSLK